MNDYIGFSRDKRFSATTFADFFKSANKLVEIVQGVRPFAKVELLVCEDPWTHNFSTVSFESDEVTAALKNRKTYALDQFTGEVWDRSFKVNLVIKDDTDPKPFMICLSCDRQSDVGRIMFYGQCLDQRTYEQILDVFAKSSLFYKIGDGFPKTSVFNVLYGEKVTGMRLS